MKVMRVSVLDGGVVVVDFDSLDTPIVLQQKQSLTLEHGVPYDQWTIRTNEEAPIVIARWLHGVEPCTPT